MYCIVTNDNLVRGYLDQFFVHKYKDISLKCFQIDTESKT